MTNVEDAIHITGTAGELVANGTSMLSADDEGVREAGLTDFRDLVDGYALAPPDPTALETALLDGDETGDGASEDALPSSCPSPDAHAPYRCAEGEPLTVSVNLQDIDDRSLPSRRDLVCPDIGRQQAILATRARDSERGPVYGRE